MAQETETHTTPADRSLGRSILWVALAVFASLYVTAINGGPLFYYDSAGYLDNGFMVMRMLGMLQTETIGGAGAGGGEALGDGTVNGSRSVVYSILVAVASARFGIIAIPFLHLAVFLITAALVIRVVGRSLNTSAPGARAFGIAVAVAGLSSLPFYIAYFMPDILAGVLVLCITLVAVFGRDMTIPEHILAIMLGCQSQIKKGPSRRRK